MTNNFYISHTEFIRELKQHNVAKKSRFAVSFNTPRVFRGNNRQLTFFCSGVSLPGIQLLTEDYKIYGGKPKIKIPKFREHDDITCIFMLTENFEPRYTFQEWMDHIIDFKTNNINYYDDIVSDIKIQVFADRQSADEFAFIGIIPAPETKPNILYQITLLNAYPTRMESVPLNWGFNDNYIEMDVQFNYEQIRFEKNYWLTKSQYKHIEKTF